MEEIAHAISAREKARGGIAAYGKWRRRWEMEEALNILNVRRLTGAAKKILASKGLDYSVWRLGHSSGGRDRAEGRSWGMWYEAQLNPGRLEAQSC